MGWPAHTDHSLSCCPYLLTVHQADLADSFYIHSGREAPNYKHIELFRKVGNQLVPLKEVEGIDDTLEAHEVHHMETLYWEDVTPKLDPSSVADEQLFETVQRALQTEIERQRLRDRDVGEMGWQRGSGQGSGWGGIEMQPECLRSRSCCVSGKYQRAP